jgi:hypothetical protein
MMTRIMQIASASGKPTGGQSGRLESSFNNEGLDGQERSEEKIEKICCPSILGGTSIC